MEYIEYIRSLIEGILVGFSAPLPISSAIHMFLAERFTGNNPDTSVALFYYYFYTLTFSVVLFFNFKNLYAKALKGIADKEKAHITRGKNILIVSAISLLLFIPVSKNGGFICFFDGFISTESVLNPLLVGIASIFSGIILLAVLESAKHSSCEKKNYASRSGVLRMSLFSLLTYVIPGFSKIATGSSNIVLSDVAPAKALRECYFYLAPQIFIVSAIRIAILILEGVNFDPIVLSLGVISAATVNFLVLNLLKKFSVKKIFIFCSAYSVAAGIISICSI